MKSPLINGLLATTSWPSMKIEAKFMKPHKSIPQEMLTPTSRNTVV